MFADLRAIALGSTHFSTLNPKDKWINDHADLRGANTDADLFHERIRKFNYGEIGDKDLRFQTNLSGTYYVEEWSGVYIDDKSVASQNDVLRDVFPNIPDDRKADLTAEQVKALANELGYLP